LSDLAKYSMTRSNARPLCDSWASCWDTDNETVYSTWNDVQMSLKIIRNVMLH